MNQSTARWFRGMGLIPVLSVLVLAAVSGCSHFGQVKDEAGPLELRVTFDKQEYRPGESIRAQVALVDHSGQSRMVPNLNARTVRFYFGKQGDPERMERAAIGSSHEALDATAPIGPSQPLQRTFVLTRLSEFTGALTAQAQFVTGAAQSAGDGLAPRVYSNAVTYAVKGEPLFERDADGLIAEKDAVGLALEWAKAKQGATTLKAGEGILVEDEAGFNCWWVNLETTRSDGAAQPLSCFVDPYLGFVRYQAKEPFAPSLAADSRRQNMPNQPRRPVNINQMMNEPAAAKPAPAGQ